MNILVLGGDGFLGRHVCEQARELGHAVSSYDVAGERAVDVRQLTPDQVAGFDRIFHLAGRLGTAETFDDPKAAVEVNTIGTLNVLQCALAQRTPVTYVSLGNNWLNPYTISKQAAARFCQMFRSVHGLPVQVAVTYNCFGPYQKAFPVKKIIPRFMYCLLRELPIELHGDGQQIVDLVYAQDLARAMLANHEPGEVHYGTAEPITVEAAARLCAKALGIGDPRIEHTGLRQGEPPHSRSLAPYPMKVRTPLEQAMRVTAEWYRRHIDTPEIGAPPAGRQAAPRA